MNPSNLACEPTLKIDISLYQVGIIFFIEFRKSVTEGKSCYGRECKIFKFSYLSIKHTKMIGHDCGVFVCLYARCLSLKYSLPHCFLSFRKQRITELHNQMIDGPFLPEVQTEQYYAVDYINRYYVGRVLSIDGSFCLMKFLHCGSKIYSWPKHDDTDAVYKSCIFYGPVTLSGSGPFTVLEQRELDKVHLCLEKSENSA